jgi:uncharacterized protein YcfL
MKKLLLLITVLLLVSCEKSTPLLNRNEYVVVDTVNVAKNGFDSVLYYSVVIKIEDDYYYAELNSNKDITSVNPRKIKYFKK